MSLADCIAEGLKASGGVLNKEQVKDILENYKAAVDGLSIEDKFATLDQVLNKAQQMQIDGQRVALLREKYLRTAIALDASRTEQAFKNVPKTGSNPIYKAFHKMFQDKENTVEVSRREILSYFTRQLDKGKAAIAFKDPAMMEQAIDLYFQPRASRSMEGVGPEVQALVEALDSTDGLIYTAANNARGYLNRRPTTLFSARSALPEKVGAMSQEDFVNHMVDLMSDDVETLQQHGIDKHEDLEARLAKVYDLLSEGEQYQSHGAFADNSQPMVKAFYGKAVNKLSDSIFDLPFSDGKAYRQFFQDFNGGDQADELMGNMRQIGRNLGMVRAFGPVPEIGMFGDRSLGIKGMIQLAQDAAETDAEKAMIAGNFAEGRIKAERSGKWTFLGNKLGAVPSAIEKSLLIGKSWLTEPNPETWFKTLAGETERVGDQSLANIGRTARGFTTLSRLLGFGHFTQWGDLPTTMAMLGKFDDNPGAAFGATMKAYMDFYNPDIKLDADHLHALETSFDIMHGNMLDMYYSGESGGFSARRANAFDKLFKYTGMHRMDWVRIVAVNEFINAHMGSALEGDYAAIRPELKTLLSDAGISEKDWSALQEGASHIDNLNGRNHLVPEDITDSEVRFKYLKMLNSAGKIAVPRPGAMEQALITRGTRPGTPEGEFWRTIGLFKSFGLAMATRVLPFIDQNYSWKGKLAWGTSMALVYIMRDAVKQALLGKTSKWTDPETYKNPMNYPELFAYSGMGGIYGDMIGQDMSKYGAAGGVGGAVAGPFLTGPVQAGIDWGASMFSKQEPGAKAVKTIRTGANMIGADKLPIITAVNNRLWLYSLYNSLQPGWLDHHLSGMKANNQSEIGY